MPDQSVSIVSKVWNFAHVLKNAGVGYGDYVKQVRGGIGEVDGNLVVDDQQE